MTNKEVMNDGGFIETQEDGDAEIRLPNMSTSGAGKIAECREIVKTVLDFGVTQEQVLQIIYLLSLNLENRDYMLRVSKVCKEVKEESCAFTQE